MMPMRCRLTPAVALFVALLTACGGGTGPEDRGTTPPPPPPPPGPVAVPARGAPATLDVASWNIEWFGDAGNGPTDEQQQLRNVRDVILGTDADVWGVAEVVDEQHWNALEAQLPGYTGFLAHEAAVTGGAAAYGAREQKVGILVKGSAAAVTGARIILAEHDQAFAGRPPLEVTLGVTVNGATAPLVVIVLHMKAFDDAESWQRRQAAAAALKAYLDATYPTQRVLVVGDWNDDVDTSITAGRGSPYAAFVQDGARYRFVTAALSARGVSSTTGYPDLIDHHLATDEMAELEVPGSVEVYRVDAHVPNFGATTSDHFPVLSRYAWR